MSAPLERFLARLDGVRNKASGFIALCPAHDDRNPSLTVDEGAEGQVLFRCWAGCDSADVVASIGLTFADLYPERQHHAPRSRRRPPPPWRDLVRLLMLETTVLEIGVTMLESGDVPGPTDVARMREALDAIAQVKGVIYADAR
jgi:hypothetical protein